MSDYRPEQDLSPHAYMDPRQKAYELSRRKFQEEKGRPVKRMDRNR